MAWPGQIPEYAENNDRLVASFEGVSLLCLRGLTVQTVWTPGFVGVIDLDSAAPDVSRNRAVKADLTKVLDQARESVSPQVVANLNALTKTLVISKTSFIAECVRYYGRQVLMRSDIPWINLLEMPGNVELTTSGELLKALTSSSLLFIAFNSGPWTAMKTWVASGNPASTELGVLIDGKGQPKPPYRGPEEKVGALLELWPTCMEGPLFGSLIDIVAEAWQVSPEELIKQDTWTHVSDSIAGRFCRR